MCEAQRVKFKPQWTQELETTENMEHLQRKSLESEKSQHKGEPCDLYIARFWELTLYYQFSDSRHRLMGFNVCFYGLRSCLSPTPIFCPIFPLGNNNTYYVQLFLFIFDFALFYRSPQPTLFANIVESQRTL